MKFNKKGAENVIASLILFIAVMALATTTTVVFKNYMDKSNGAVNEQQVKSTDIIKTSFDITVVTYDGSGTTRAYIKNTGSTRFDPSEIDIYIDGERIARNPGNRSVDVVADTDTTNVGIWDPKEELEVEVYKTFLTSDTREFLLAAPNGVTAEEEFSS